MIPDSCIRMSPQHRLNKGLWYAGNRTKVHLTEALNFILFFYSLFYYNLCKLIYLGTTGHDLKLFMTKLLIALCYHEETEISIIIKSLKHTCLRIISEK